MAVDRCARRWLVAQFTLPITVAIALFFAALYIAYERMFMSEYRDLVKVRPRCRL